MTSFWEILKSSKNLKASDAFAELWGKSIADSWDIITITGNLPLTFEAKGEALKNYRLHGTENGAGVQTENVVSSTIPAANIDVTGRILSRNASYLAIAPIEQSKSYSFMTEDVVLFAFYDSLPQMGSIAYDALRHDASETGGVPTFIAPITGYVAYRNINKAPAMLVEGDVVPTTYIPYGYQISLTVTSGEQSQDYLLYIGSTKLGAEEYVDYEEQKVYKRTENLFDYSMSKFGYYINSEGQEVASTSGQIGHSDYIDVDPSTEYTIRADYQQITSAATGLSISWYDSNKTFILRRTLFVDAGTSGVKYAAFVSPSNAYYAIINFPCYKSGYNDYTVFKAGSTSPSSYIPYLQPTDPPVPFPAILTYKGENTLSSTETVGEVSVTGKIKEI